MEHVIDRGVGAVYKQKKNVAVSFVCVRNAAEILTNHEMINKSDKASGFHLYYIEKTGGNRP